MAAMGCSNPAQLAKLNQPPYGDRAIIHRSENKLIGACGYVPCLGFFEQLHGFSAQSQPPSASHNSTEFGLFYAISPDYQHQGFATEAAQALIDYAFKHLHLKRIVAETDYTNIGSIRVMQKLGMRTREESLSRTTMASGSWSPGEHSVVCRVLDSTHR